MQNYLSDLFQSHILVCASDITSMLTQRDFSESVFCSVNPLGKLMFSITENRGLKFAHVKRLKRRRAETVAGIHLLL